MYLVKSIRYALVMYEWASSSEKANIFGPFESKGVAIRFAREQNVRNRDRMRKESQEWDLRDTEMSAETFISEDLLTRDPAMEICFHSLRWINGGHRPQS